MQSLQKVQKQNLKRSTLNCCWIKLFKCGSMSSLELGAAKCEKASGPVLLTAGGFKAVSASG